MPDKLSRDDSERDAQVEDGETDGRGGVWVAGQVVLFGLFLVSVIGSGPIPEVPGIHFARIVGILVALGGAALSSWAFLHHGSDLTPFPKPVDGQQLIDQGPYRYVRHPMYSGIIAFTLGVGLAYANPATMLSSLAFTVFFMAKTGHEEEMLIRHVPGYRAYRAAVPWRLIPFVM